MAGINASHASRGGTINAFQNKSFVLLLMNRKNKFHDDDKLDFISFCFVVNSKSKAITQKHCDQTSDNIGKKLGNKKKINE